MPEKIASIVKISRPKLSDAIARKRLFRLLDGCGMKPVTWVSAPAGSGKTTLVASWLDARKLPCIWYSVDAGDADIASFFYYMGLAAKKAAPRYKKPLPPLTPEYLMGLSTFTKRWFENLFNRLTSAHASRLPSHGFILVFDNYQDVAPDSGLHDVLRDGVSVIPDGVRVIVISRHEPPPAFARVEASGSMSVVGWESVRFTLEESKSLVGARERLSDDAVRKLHGATGGWAAGLVLMLGRAENPAPEGALLTEKVFDYFVGEVLDKLDSETRDFLLMASFLPRMTPETTAKLTGNDQAGKILSGLRRKHFFTEQQAATEAVYQFHSLFRSFLLTRVKESLSGEGIQRVQNRAAALLVETGQIEDAVGLLLEAADWESAIPLILGHAQALTAQGRSRTLEAWLNCIPAEISDATPWLLFWKASCRLPFDPVKSRIYYERAFSLFKAAHDPAGSFLSCTGVMNTYLFHWNRFTDLPRWINECESLLKKYGEFPGKEIEIQVITSMFLAIFITQPQYTDSAGWASKARMVIQTCPDNNVRVMVGSHLLWYYTMVSRISDATAIKNEIGPLLRLPDITPLSHISWYCLEAVYGWVTASFDACREAIRKGLEISDTTGVVVMRNKLFAQGAYCAATTGDCKESSEYLKKLASATDFNNHIDAGHYYHLASLDAFCRSDHANALDLAQKALDLVTNGGMPFSEVICRSILAQALSHAGDYANAKLQLDKALAQAKEIHAVPIEFVCYLVEAGYLLRKGGAGKEALDSLHFALKLGREHNILNISMMPRSDVAQYCATALEAGIEKEYVQELIRKHKLTPPETGDQQLENWPWPVKIYTLGRFGIEVEGKGLALPRSQQKPLLMLKAMIAFGGEEVSEDLLTDALWPEAEGDVGRRSFDTTLHRLRKLLGNDKAIRILKGRLTLDPGYFWTDVRAFDRLVGKAGALWSDEEGKGKKHDESVRLYEKAAALYKGHFLPSDTREAWATPARERARMKFITAAVRLSRRYQLGKNYEKAIQFLKECVAIDELSEELYQGLMACYQQTGRTSEAASVYHQCRKMLSQALGVEPSPKTEELYNALRKTRKSD